ncbi:MAG: hypothetical protein HC906_19825 [Bacteroidales bacterium]|nr:hypothetical protein [Bacteroidales bacterium]
MSIPQLSASRRENMPAWTPDGKYLYFISAPEMNDNKDETRLHAMYDLMRISYDTDSNSWGDVETIINSSETGKSISMPAVSPDGRFLVFSMSEYGYFTFP